MSGTPEAIIAHLEAAQRELTVLEDRRPSEHRTDPENANTMRLKKARKSIAEIIEAMRKMR